MQKIIVTMASYVQSKQYIFFVYIIMKGAKMLGERFVGCWVGWCVECMEGRLDGLWIKDADWVTEGA